MARWKVEGKSVIVEKGDTLWGIAERYRGKGILYKELAKINNIKDPDKISIGQTIELYGSGSSGGSSGSTSKNPARPDILQFGELSSEPGKLYATWECDNHDLSDGYKVLWTYYATTSNGGAWFEGRKQEIQIDKDSPLGSTQDTYTVPVRAIKVKFKVIPVPKKDKDKNGKETEKFRGVWSAEKEYVNNAVTDAPSIPSVKINENLELTATVDNIDIYNATHIEFEVVRKDDDEAYDSKKVAIILGSASALFTVPGGYEYKVRARAWNNSVKIMGPWSDYSAFEGTRPAAPEGITTIKAKSKTSVYLEWKVAKGTAAESYDIEYAEKEEYFDGSDQTTTKTDIETTHYELGGLATGTRYFFRVRAVNEDSESDWTKPESVEIGTKPAAPTTWSSTTTVIVGEPLTLFWVHNTKDGSRQTFADIELYVDEQKIPMQIIEYPEVEDEDEEETISHYDIDTTEYPEGAEIQWRVRTAGIIDEFGDWSVQRTVNVYTRPSLLLKVTDIDGNPISNLTSFPFYIYGLAGPNTQKPIGYHLSIISNDTYDAVDNIGNTTVVNVGDQVYSKHFDIQDALLVEMSANNIDLENNVNYTIVCTASMDSGLTAEASKDFTVSWNEVLHSPNASISLDSDNLSTAITPYCEDVRVVYYKVEHVDGAYSKTTEDIGWMPCDVSAGVMTSTDELVYIDTDADGNESYYCRATEVTPVTDIYLSVYRREFDGGFTKLAKSIDGIYRTTVIDPHPSLDYARYRIVATSKNTGSVSFTDLPGHPVNGKSVVIQWDEGWTNFEVDEDASMVDPPWTGSLLKLPYNIDVSDNNRSDVALVEYIGRTHPVSYYGTQLGQSSSWNVEIPKSDKETLYALRRLSRWMGDVYVREPSGSGYWANITVSFNQKHKAVTIPVTLDIKRVEGGA